MRRRFAILAGFALIVLMLGVFGYVFDVLSLRTPEQPYRDPRLDTFEVKTVPGDGSNTSLSVKEPGAAATTTVVNEATTSSAPLDSSSEDTFEGPETQ